MTATRTAVFNHVRDRGSSGVPHRSASARYDAVFFGFFELANLGLLLKNFSRMYSPTLSRLFWKASLNVIELTTRMSSGWYSLVIGGATGFITPDRGLRVWRNSDSCLMPSEPADSRSAASRSAAPARCSPSCCGCTWCIARTARRSAATSRSIDSLGCRWRK